MRPAGPVEQADSSGRGLNFVGKQCIIRRRYWIYGDKPAHLGGEPI